MAKEKKTKASDIKFFDSIKTRLISVMMLVAIVPLIVAIIVSYVTSTKKATADAIDALDWQAWYIESSFETVIQKNIVAMQAIAAAPSTKTFYINPNDLTAASKAQAYLNTIDAALGDGNISVLTGADGMQLLRASGKLVDVSSPCQCNGQSDRTGAQLCAQSPEEICQRTAGARKRCFRT